MFVGLVEAEALVAQVAAGVDPNGCTPAQAAAALERFATIEKLATGARLLLAARAAQSQVWREAGYRSAAHWLAHQLGVTVFDARRILGASGALDDLADTAAALRQGELSGGQAEEIADTATKAPGSERALLGEAARGDLANLKEQGRRRRAAAAGGDETARRDKIRAARSLRFHTDDDGAAHLSAKGLPEAVAEMRAHLRPFIDEAFHTARRHGRRETLDAYAFDALLSALRTANTTTGTAAGPTTANTTTNAQTDDDTGQPGDDETAPSFPDERPDRGPTSEQRPARRAPGEVIVLADLTALRRGHTQAGETCQIPGIGPVSVAAATELLGHALLSLVITDGVDINTVVRAGRGLTPEQRVALLVRDRECAVPHCHQTDHLETHHTVPYTDTGHTTLTELARVCRYHHDLITHHSYDLRGPPGHRQWLTPDQTRTRAAPAA